MNIKVRYFLFIAVPVLSLFGCGKTESVPRGFPDEDSMAVILADIYYTEAVINQSRDFVRGKDEELPKFYKYIFEKHGIDKKQYDTVFAWYSEHPKLLSEVYDKVIFILNEKEAGIKPDTIKSMKLKKPIRIPKMEDVWTGKRSFDVKDTTNNNVPFSIKIDSLTGGIYRLMATYRFAKGTLLDKAYMKLIACYSDSTADTASYSIDRSFSERITTLSLGADKNKPVVELKGFLMKHDTTVDAFGFIKGVKLLYIPKSNSGLIDR